MGVVIVVVVVDIVVVVVVVIIIIYIFPAVEHFKQAEGGLSLYSTVVVTVL